MIENFTKNKITIDEIQKYYRSIVSERNQDTLMHPLPNIVKDSDRFYQKFLESIPEMKYYKKQARQIYNALVVRFYFYYCLV